MPGPTPRPFRSTSLAQRRLRPKAQWLYGVFPAPWTGGTQVGNAQTSVTLDFTTVPDGDWCFASINLSDSQAAVPLIPAGWTIVMQGSEGTSGSASSFMAVYMRRKQPGDTTQLFTWGTAANMAAIPISWAGLDPSSPIEKPTYGPHASGAWFIGLTLTKSTEVVVTICFDRTTVSTGSFTMDPAIMKRVEAVSLATPWCIAAVGDTNITVASGAQSYASNAVADTHGGVIAFALNPPFTSPAIPDLTMPPKLAI